MEISNWIELAQATCHHAGIDTRSIDIIATWDDLYCANAIFKLADDRYLKIFGPESGRQFQVESTALRLIETQNAIPAPRILDEGQTAQKQDYLIISGIPGDTAEHLWDELPRPVQLELAREIGSITAAIHRLPLDKFAAVEQQVGGLEWIIEKMQKRHIPRIKSLDAFTIEQREAILDFFTGEAHDLLFESRTFTHYEMAHNHLYLQEQSGKMRVSGIIDWADALIGPAEWDVMYLWFWTFSKDKGAMREYLKTLYADNPPPQNFARRCMAAAMYTASMGLLWSDLAEHGFNADSVARDMTEFFFPPDVFGSPE